MESYSGLRANTDFIKDYNFRHNITTSDGFTIWQGRGMKQKFTHKVGLNRSISQLCKQRAGFKIHSSRNKFWVDDFKLKSQAFGDRVNAR